MYVCTAESDYYIYKKGLNIIGCNRKTTIENHRMQWSIVKVLSDKQWLIKHYTENYSWSSTNTTKSRVWPHVLWTNNHSCYTSGTRHVTHINKSPGDKSYQMICHKQGKYDDFVTTTSGTNISFMTKNHFITVSQVMMATVSLLKWRLQLYHKEPDTLLVSSYLPSRKFS